MAIGWAWLWDNGEGSRTKGPALCPEGSKGGPSSEMGGAGMWAQGGKEKNEINFRHANFEKTMRNPRGAVSCQVNIQVYKEL